MIIIKKLQSRIFTFVAAPTLILLCVSGTALAQFSANNGRILWTSTDGQYTVKPDGSDESSLGIARSNSSRGWQSIFTPNGKYIIYESNNTAQGTDIFITDVEKAINPVKLASYSSLACLPSNPAVNSSSTKLAFECFNSSGLTEIYVIDLSISNGNIAPTPTPLRLTNSISSGSSFEPVWSPDNSKIYIRNQGGGGGATRILAISPTQKDQNSNIQEVANVATGSVLNDVSPDGSKLLYSSQSGELRAVSTNPGNQGSSIVKKEEGYAFYGYFSPDGKSIVANKSPVSSNSSPGQLVIFGSDGQGNKVFSQNTIPAMRPFWSTNSMSLSGSEQLKDPPGVPAVSSVEAQKGSTTVWILAGLLTVIIIGTTAYWISVEFRHRRR